MGIATLAPDDPTLHTVRRVDAQGALTKPEGPIDSALLMRMFREMRRVRRIDERMLARQRQGRVGFYGAITGQEAVPVAAALALQPTDWVFPALRESAIMLVRGFPLSRWLAQVYGSADDVLQGRQMPSHMSSRDVHQVSWSSCIGLQLPQAVGAAMAAKLKGDGGVTAGFLGDGATSTPAFHGAMNFAAVYRAPCIFICQNNQWSISLPTEQQTASQTLASKAHAYGMPGIRVDGNDAWAVHDVIKEAAARARSGGGPTFIEALTYRMGPHSSSDDPSRYRSDDEVERWRRRDPLDRLQKLLEREGGLTEPSLSALDRELAAELDEALQHAEAQAPPTRQSLFQGVFASLPWHLEEQQRELERED